MPDNPQLRLTIGRVDGDDDLIDDRAQQLLAFADRGGRRVKHGADISAGPFDPGRLVSGQRDRAAGLLGGQLGLGSADLAERLFPDAFQSAGHEPVLRLDRVVLAACAVGFVAGALDGQLEGGQPAGVAGVGLSQRRRGGSKRGRGQHSEHLVEHTLLQAAVARAGHRSSPEHVIWLNNLGTALRTLWGSRREQSDLAECLALHRAVVDAAPKGHRSRSSFLNNLATALLDACDVAEPAAAVAALRGAQPLAEATSLLEEAIGCSPEGAAELPIYVTRSGLRNTLGNVRFREWELTRRSDLLDDAIKQYERAARLAADGAPDQWTYRANAASAKGDRALRSGDESELDEVLRSYREIVTSAGPLETEVRLRAARGWARVAVQASRWTGAAEALRQAIDTVEVLVGRQSADEDKERWLATVSGVAASGAYATARTGDWLGAAAIMERGRAVLLSEALDLERQELEQLAGRGYAAQVEQFVGVNRQLAALERARRLGSARPYAEPPIVITSTVWSRSVAAPSRAYAPFPATRSFSAHRAPQIWRRSPRRTRCWSTFWPRAKAARR